MNLISGSSYSRQLYLLGIVLLVIALPLSMFLMSVAQFVLIGAWVSDSPIKQKIKNVFSNKFFLLLAGVYAIHLIGLLYTTDFNYAMRDLRIKLPLLILPLILISSKPLEEKQFHFTLKIFIAAVFISALVSIAVYAGVINKTLHNIRDISIFISHIRLSLLVCVAIVCCMYFFSESTSLKSRLGLISLIIYFAGFLLLLESLTGLFVLACLLLFGAYRYLLTQSARMAQWGFAIICLIIIVSSLKLYQFVFVDSIKETTADLRNLPKQTVAGNDYFNDTTQNDLENGNPVWITVCEQELDTSWNRRSKLLYSGKDEKGQDIKYTLIRFLASKNLKRDAEGVAQLKEEEVRAIENGVANVNHTQLSNVCSRIEQLAWEYRQYHFYGYATGHSLMQRFEFWKTGLFIIKQHPLKGVGTGDVQLAFDDAYQKTNSHLNASNRLRSHNQYLTMGVAFGVMGAFYYLISLLLPWFWLKKNDFLYSAFLIIALLSMFTEDTLETQAGATFYAFFNAYFITQSDEFKNRVS